MNFVLLENPMCKMARWGFVCQGNGPATAEQALSDSHKRHVIS